MQRTPQKINVIPYLRQNSGQDNPDVSHSETIVAFCMELSILLPFEDNLALLINSSTILFPVLGYKTSPTI